MERRQRGQAGYSAPWIQSGQPASLSPPSHPSRYSNWVPGGKRPPEISIMFASAPPTRNPFENTWRMLRERCISAAITDPSIACW